MLRPNDNPDPMPIQEPWTARHPLPGDPPLGLSAPNQLAELYARLYPMVHHLCTQMLGDTVEAADAAQEVFLTVCDKGHAFRHEASVKTWLFRITVNHCLNRLRARAFRQRALGEMAQINKHVIYQDDDQILECRNLLRRLLATCNPTEVDLVMAVYLFQLDQKELGASMGISDRTVRKRLRRVRGKIEKQAKDTGEGVAGRPALRTAA